MERKGNDPRHALVICAMVCKLVVTFALILLGMLGCSLGGPPDPVLLFIHSQHSNNPRQERVGIGEARVRIVGSHTSVEAGERVDHQVLRTDGETGPLRIKISVPMGATNYLSDPAPMPGGPPYIYPHMEGTGALVTYTYETPDLPEGSDGTTCADVVETRSADPDNDPNEGGHATTILEYLLVPPHDESPHNASRGEGVADEAADPLPAAADVTIWRVMRILDYAEQELTSELCRDWIEFLAEGDGFVAVRLPLEASTYPTESVSLPLYADAEHPLALSFDIFHPSARAYSAPLVVRPEFMEHAANTLPAAEGEVWVTLGVWGDAPAVPDGISSPAGGWAAVVDLFLNLSAQPDAGAGLGQPLYICTVEEVESALAGAASVSSDCISCIGPQSLTMVDMDHDWTLRGNNTDQVGGGEVIEFSHVLRNMLATPIEVDFTISSTLDIDWTLYAGECANPSGRQPVTGGYTLAGRREACLWLMSQAVPPDTVSGYYGVVLTAVDAAGAERWGGDQFWVDGVTPTATATATATPTLTETPTLTPTATPETGYTILVPLILRAR